MKLQCSAAAAFLAACAFACMPAHAFDAAGERAEHDRIKLEREQAEAAYQTQERECRQRFVVTPCLDQAKRDRRQAMDRLRQQQEVLDEAQRKQRAAQRIDEIRAKVSGDEAKQREAMARERRKEKQRAEAAAAAASNPVSEAAGASSAASSAEAGRAHVPSSSAKSSADEAKHLADYERRQHEAQAHKDAVARRNAERAATGKPAAKGLPTPGSAPASH
jgi:colicin import membrane protein